MSLGMLVAAKNEAADKGSLMIMNKCGNVTIPSAYEYFFRLRVENLVLSIIAIILTTAMTILFAIEMYYVFKYVSPYMQRAGKLIWMAGVQPLTAIACLIAVCIPRASAIMEMFILLYFARCLFSVTQLVVEFFGGRLEMARALQGTTIRLSTLPVCCCCRCLPNVKPTAKVLRRIEWLVYQAAILRPLTFLITGTISADSLGNPSMEATHTKISLVQVLEQKDCFQQSVNTVTSVINIVSTLMAMYGFILMANMTDKPLKPYRTKALMKLTQLTIAVYNIQGAIFNLLANQGVIQCDDLLPAVARAAEWNFLLLILESFLISMGAAFFLRPSVNETFDLYPTHLAKEPSGKHPKSLEKSNYHEIVGVDVANGELKMKEGNPYHQVVPPYNPRNGDPLFRHPRNNGEGSSTSGQSDTRGRSQSQIVGQSFHNSEPIGITV